MPSLIFVHPVWNGFRSVSFPQGATYRGAEAVVVGVFKANDARWEKFSFHIEQYLEAGDSVLVIGAYVGRHHQSQKPLHAAAAHVYDLANGKVCRFRMFKRHKTDLGCNGLMTLVLPSPMRTASTRLVVDVIDKRGCNHLTMVYICLQCLRYY